MVLRAHFLAALLALTHSAAFGATIEHLGRPCRALSPMASRMIIDRSDGRERLAFANANESGVELVFLDFEKNESRVYKWPGKSTAGWDLIEISNNRLVMATAGGVKAAGKLLVFDLTRNEFVKEVSCGGDMFAWTLAIGGDGRVYAGTWSGGNLYALDTKTYEIEDLGAHGLPNIYLRYLSAMPDGRILCRYLFEKPLTLIFDPATKEFREPPEQLKNTERGISWRGYFITMYSVFDGKTLARIDPPFPTPPADKGPWAIELAISDDAALFIRQGASLYRWTPGAKELEKFAEPDMRGGYLVARSKSGALIGIRGRDYFLVRQGDKAPKLMEIRGESAPRPTFFLRVDDKGQIWGGAHFGNTIFRLDPKTKEAFNTRAICKEGGEVYDAAFLDGKPYFTSYTSGGIIFYEPDQPWDEYNGKNPRVMMSTVQRGYIRPQAGITLGPDGKFYVGLMAKYGTYGGAIAITDPKTGATDLIENPLGQQGIESVVVGDGVIYVGTNCAGNGLPSRYDIATKFGIVDLATKKTIFEEAPGGCSPVRALGYDRQSKRVVVAVGKSVRFFDASSREFLPDACKDAPELTCKSVGWPGDGKLYYGSGKWVVSLDARNGKADRVVEAPARVDHVALGPDGTIYFACDADIYKVIR